jgi:hypothetical protein
LEMLKVNAYTYIAVRFSCQALKLTRSQIDSACIPALRAPSNPMLPGLV